MFLKSCLPRSALFFSFGQQSNYLLIFFILSNFFVGCQATSTKDPVTPSLLVIETLLLVTVIIEGTYRLVRWVKKKTKSEKKSKQMN